MPRFSIIVPVYNVEEYLDECVQSVISQTFMDWELLLVDDGSPDGCPAMCDNYAALDSRIKALHKKNGGLSDARNVGLDVASGDYALFLDSDDFWGQKNALERLEERIKTVNADIVIFGCTDFNIKTGEVIVSRSGYDLELFSKGNKKDVLHYLFSTKMLPGGATIFAFKRSIIENNMIRFKVGIQDEDYDFVLGVFLYAESIDAIDDPFYMYRHGRTGSITGSANVKMIYGIEYTVNKWLPIALEIDDEVIKKDYLNYIAFIYSTGYVVCGRMHDETRKEALEIMKKYKNVLKYAYWKKPVITRYAVSVLGVGLFSRLASVYYDKTHIQTVNR